MYVELGLSSIACKALWSAPVTTPIKTAMQVREVAERKLGKPPDVVKPLVLQTGFDVAKTAGYNPADGDVIHHINNLANIIMKEAAEAGAAVETQVAPATATPAGTFVIKPGKLGLPMAVQPGVMKIKELPAPTDEVPTSFMDKLTSPMGLVALAGAGILGYMLLKKK